MPQWVYAEIEVATALEKDAYDINLNSSEYIPKEFFTYVHSGLEQRTVGVHMTDMLNILGKSGWELVSVAYDTHRKTLIHYLKRQID